MSANVSMNSPDTEEAMRRRRMKPLQSCPGPLMTEGLRKNEKGGLQAWHILLIILGVVALVVGMLILMWWFVNARKSQQSIVLKAA